MTTKEKKKLAIRHFTIADKKKGLSMYTTEFWRNRAESIRLKNSI